MSQILESLAAFHQNGISYLVYAIINNWWFLLLAAGATISVIMYLREELSVTVRDEQQAL